MDAGYLSPCSCAQAVLRTKHTTREQLRWNLLGSSPLSIMHNYWSISLPNLRCC